MFLPDTRIITIFVLLVLSGHLSPLYAQLNEAVEPPLELKLVVDGKTYFAQLGRPLEVSVKGKKTQLIVSKGNERELKLQHLSFRYPEYFKHEISLDDETNVPDRWDLEGIDVDVTVFRISPSVLKYLNNKSPMSD